MTDKTKLQTVCSFLKYKVNGIRSCRVAGDCVELEPYDRQRLDHYGNDGDGWDDDGWWDDYAGPWTSEIEALLKECEHEAYANVGDKGYIYVYLKN